MTVRTKAQLQAEAAQIANETTKRANTAVRVGNALLDVVDTMPTVIDITSYGVSTTAAGAANDTAIAAAIAAATASHSDLYWPGGTYPSAASIASLHSVRHRGPGAISRNGDTWYVQPKYGQTNRLYVATTGSAASDGIAFGSFMAKPQDAFDAMRNYGPVLDGTWKVILSAGTYTVHDQQFDTPSRDWVVIQGPTAGHPTVPTAIFDGTGFAANQHGFITTGIGVQLWYQDIKVQNYNAGAQNSAGFVQSYASRCIFVNCHAFNCDFAGVVADQGDICLVSGGIYDTCRTGIILNATKGTVGYNASGAGAGTHITSCTQNGVYWSRGAQGHVDNCLFDQNPFHVQIESAARAHLLGNDFRRASNAAVTTNSDGSYYDDVSSVNTYNDGTGHANATRYKHFAYTQTQQSWLDTGVSEMRIAIDDTQRFVSGTTAKTTLSTPWTVPANWFTDNTKKIRVKVWGNLPAIPGVSVGVDMGATQMDQSTPPGTPGNVDFVYEVEIYASSSSAQRSFAELVFSNGNNRVQNTGNAAPVSTGLALKITGQLPTAVATMFTRRVEVYVTG